MDAAQRADDSVRAIRQAHKERPRGLLISAAPGAGKTRLVAQLVADAVRSGERAIVTSYTNRQVMELARRFRVSFPERDVVLLLSRDAVVPAAIQTDARIDIVRSWAKNRPTPPILLATASRLSYVRPGRLEADRAYVDEAYQITDVLFRQIVGHAMRHVLVGDAGQLAPVAASDVVDLQTPRGGPHIAAPYVLARRHPWVSHLQLPVTWRLPEDTVEIIQPAFYTDLPMIARFTSRDRLLMLQGSHQTALDTPLEILAGGRSIALVTLPHMVAGSVDRALVGTIIGLIGRLLERHGAVRQDNRVEPLTPADIGVVCQHVDQVTAVIEALPHALADVYCETSHRWQGLQRKVVIVYHSLAGQSIIQPQHLDAANLCVMLTRHLVACILVTRDGVNTALQESPPLGQHTPGEVEDVSLRGWYAHAEVLRRLEGVSCHIGV